MKMQYRQGDVLIEKIEEIPGNTQPSNDQLLVRGEGRYHGHFMEGEVDIMRNQKFGPEDNTSHYLRVRSKSELVHRHTESKAKTGDHETITIPAGRYRVIRQREYNPYLRAIQILKD